MSVSIEIRAAQLNDAPSIAQVHIRSWKTAYRGIIDQDYLDNGLDLAVRTRRWQENLR